MTPWDWFERLFVSIFAMWLGAACRTRDRMEADRRAARHH